MIAFVSILVICAAAPASEVEVHKGEQLADVAQRTLGSPQAAPELAALNHLSRAAKLHAGMHLKVPGQERTLAIQAIESAKTAITQADGDDQAREAARTRLHRAEALLAQARYPAAAQEADAAWKLLTQSSDKSSQFSVEVEDNGHTRVKVQKGEPVRVEAEGKVQAVTAGERTDIAQGEAPEAAVPDVLEGEALSAPELLRPAQNGKVTVQPDAHGRGVVEVAWRTVPGASAYRVDLFAPKGSKVGDLHLKVTHTEVSFPRLAAGTYRWRVRAVGEGSTLGPYAERSFELVPSTLLLKVKESGWK